MVLQNVPDQVNAGTSLEEAVAGITAIVSFEEGVTKTVTAEELQFTAIPNMNELGTKTLVVIYNKTFKGENCNQPVVANATFEVVEKIVSIQVTAQPAHTQYYYYTSAATETMTDRTLAFLPEGLEVTATYADGSTRVVDNAKLHFSAIPAKAGTQTVTITADEVTATVEVKVAESVVAAVSNSAGIIGAEDNSTVGGLSFLTISTCRQVKPDPSASPITPAKLITGATSLSFSAKPILPNMQWYAPTTMDGVQDTMEMPASFTTVHKATGLLGLPI